MFFPFCDCDHTYHADVEDVKFVINLDYPSNSEDYVHRIGCTGRSQRTGTAYAFFTPANAHKASDLIQVLEEAKQVVNPKLYELSRNPGVYKSKYRSFFTSLSFLFFFYIYTFFFFCNVWL